MSTISSENPAKQSQLISVLREGVSVVQMILYKQVRAGLASKHPEKDAPFLAMLAGAVVNDVFGTANPQEKFVTFRGLNRGLIEQELLSLKDEQTHILPALTDALRILSLCDNQEGVDSTVILARAKELGILLVDRTVPMPSTFMTLVRGLGEEHNLIIAPVEITPAEDRGLVH